MSYEPIYGSNDANEALKEIHENGFEKNRLLTTIKEFKKLDIEVEKHGYGQNAYNMYVCHGWWESTKSRLHGWRYISIEEIILSIYKYSKFMI